MATSTIDPSAIRNVVEDVLRQLSNGNSPAPTKSAAPDSSDCGCDEPGKPCDCKNGKLGVFQNATDATAAAHKAFLQLKDKGLEGRRRVCEIVKELCVKNAEAWGKFEFEETKIGRLDHKIEKLQIIKDVPGIEWLRPDAMSGDGGITLEEFAPFGVVGAILPVTHSVPTMSGNIISMVAAGNAVVFNPHPGGAKSACMALQEYNKVIERELGISNLICAIEKPTLESFDELCQSEHTALLAITGGPMVVKAAMASGKRAICAGPGNPPVVVDESANIEKAAKDIITGAAYDNNLLCIGEKSVFVIDSVFDQFMAAMRANGGAELNASQLAALTDAAFTDKPDAGGCSHPVLNREFVGADPAVLAQHAGATIPAGTQLLFAETDAEHVFVLEEQMMPMLPIVRVRDFDEAVAGAMRAEHGYGHSAIIHSLNVDHMTKMAKAVDTTLFVKNGPSTAGLGLGGEGYLSYSIATTTGEGITTPKTFTRIRRCVLVENLRII